jgi:hypothetical protein
MVAAVARRSGVARLPLSRAGYRVLAWTVGPQSPRRCERARNRDEEVAMAEASRRASRPYRRFEGLVVSSQGKSARERVRKALRRAGLQGWKLAALAPNAPFLVATPPRGQRVDVGRAWEYAYRLRADRDIERAEPAFETFGLDGGEPARAAVRRGVKSGGGRTSHPIETDPHDWVIRRCRIDMAWQRFGTTPPGEGVVIAHPDTGYSDHPQLDTGALRPDLGFDFYADRSDPRDPLTSGSRGHGTATASVIVSATDAEVLGAAPGSTLVPLRVDNDVIHFSWLELSRALYWAVAGGMPVVSMSLGGPWGGGVLRDAIAHATSNGLILIAAAGNQVGSVVYPACLPEVIAVAASNVFDEPWSGSCRGPEVDVSAPGESVWRAKASAPGTFAVERSEGTSYATATTAGVCALWLAHHGGFAALAAHYGTTGVAGVFKEALLASARVPADWDGAAMGAGIVDAESLLQRPLPADAPARGIRTMSRRPAAPTPRERIESFFPDAEPERVHEVLRALLRPGKRRPLRAAEIAPFADELEFQVATDPALRAAIAARLRPSRAALRATPARFALAGASGSLARAIGR